VLSKQNTIKIRMYSKQTEFIKFNSSFYFSLSNIIFLWFQRQEARNKHNSMKKWRNRTGNKIVRPLYSFNLVRPLYSFFKKMHNFVMQLYKGWKLFLTGKLAIVHKMSLLILLKMRFLYWKQRILVTIRPLYSSPKTTFSTFRL
jgi:hypothetical protein